ncbi:Tox-REase-5 domain-containing protein [Stigmatella erecta]|nr:Tox-REase-5 domain-containing protein [Stigmatella erecta]
MAGAILLVLGMALSGCATGHTTGKHTPADAFLTLQHASGLEEDDWHPPGESLEPEDSRALWDALTRAKPTLARFAPRRTLHTVLHPLLPTREAVPYAECLRRLRPFQSLVVMRPDGYLASALSGRALQRMGTVELRDGRLMAGAFEVGAFYLDKGGVFFTPAPSLQAANGLPLGELGLEHDVFNAALDGAEDALAEMVLALGHLVLHPIRSLEGLAQLPSAVAALVASSPEYFARYSALPLQEQVREAARLSTHLLTFYGSASGTAARLGKLGPRLPVLSLSAQGSLTLAQAALPAGTRVTALGSGASSVYVLMAPAKPPRTRSTATPAQEPGQWRRRKFSGSPQARRYQEQISGRSADEVYYIGEVEYDGFQNGVLLEAKAENYRQFFDKDGQPYYWFEASGSFKQLIEQAYRQSQTAKGLVVQWHVAEQGVATLLRQQFKSEKLFNIEVVYTPPKH